MIVRVLECEGFGNQRNRGPHPTPLAAEAKNRSLTVAAPIRAARVSKRFFGRWSRKNCTVAAAASCAWVVVASWPGAGLLADEPRSGTPGPAVAPHPEADAKNEKNSDAYAEGVWPSKRLLRSLLARRAEDIAREQGFDDEQKSRTRELIIVEWSEFLNERRDQLQPLLNEFLELRLDVEPPAKERVQAWAEKAGPVFDQLRERVATTIDGLRTIVKPEQRIAFEAEAIKLKAGLALAETRLRQWRTGEFDSKEFWEPLPSDRRKERNDRDASAVEADAPAANSSAERGANRPMEPESEDQIALELKLWERYVSEFSERYRLDPAQRDAIRSCLSEMKGRAATHRDRHREDIAALERRIAASRGQPDEVEAIRRDVVALYGPVDDLFAELKRRIEPIPTSEQRVAAEKRGGADVPPSKNP